MMIFVICFDIGILGCFADDLEMFCSGYLESKANFFASAMSRTFVAWRKFLTGHDSQKFFVTLWACEKI